MLRVVANMGLWFRFRHSFILGSKVGCYHIYWLLIQIYPGSR
jgi:hypothetical protein